MSIKNRGLLTTRDAIVLLGCLVFVAVGFTPLLSVATLGLVYLIWRLGFVFEDVVATTLFFGLVLLFPLITVLWDSSYSFSAAALRLAVCFALTFFLIGKRFDVSSDDLRACLLGALVIVAAAVTLQRAAILFGVYVNMPASLIAQKGSGTLVDASSIALLRSLGHVQYRPSLFYAEPSYLGLVTLSLFASLLVHSRTVKDAALGGIAVVAVVMASGSGYLAVTSAVIYLVYGASNKTASLTFRRRIRAVLVTLLALVLAVAVLPLDRRLALLFSSGDASAATRLIMPLGYVQSTWFHISPLGYPVEAVYSKLTATGLSPYLLDPPLHNGAWNILINFGVLGIAAFVALRLRVGNWLGFTFIVLGLMQNGAFGNWDKAFIIGLTCVLINSARAVGD